MNGSVRTCLASFLCTVSYACAPAPDGPAANSGSDPALVRQSETNKALAQRVGELKRMLEGDVCRDSAGRPAKALDRGVPAGSGQGAQPGAPDPQTGTSESSGQPRSPGSAESGGSARPLTRSEMVARLQDAVVLVIAGGKSGSGFFVAPDLVVTNNHVIETAKGAEVVVVGRGLGRARKAMVLRRVGGAETIARDYAALRVEGARVQQYLRFSDSAGELEKVVAAGFPALLLDNDTNFQALLTGDGEAIPELVLSQGVIMAVQKGERGLLSLAHSAAISTGNSGGPLVDACGRVLGINTFIAVAAEQGTNAGYALSSRDLVAFLKGQKLPVSLDDSPCEE